MLSVFGMSASGIYKLVLVLAVLLVYLNTLKNGYNLDDNLVTQNHRFTSKGLSGFGNILTSSYYSDNADISFGYRPVSHLSFAIEHQLFGENAFVSHFVNLILFLLTVLLFNQLIRQWAGQDQYHIAFIAALLFAVHPVHTEVVASIKNRDELLAFLFVMLSAIFFGKNEKGRQWQHWVLTALFFALAMLSKKSIYPMVFIAPVACFLLQQASVKQVLIAMSAMVIPAAALGSELEPQRAALMFTLPFLFIGFAHLIKSRSLYIPVLKQFSVSIYVSYVCSLIIWIIVVYACYRWQIAYTLLAVPFSLFVVRRQNRWGMFQVGIQLALIGTFFDYLLLNKLSVALIAGYTWYSFFNKKSSYQHWLVNIIVILCYAKRGLNIMEFISIINIHLVFYLINRNSLWAILFCGVNFIFTVFLFDSIFYQAILLTSSVLFYLISKQSFIKLSHIVVPVVIVSLLFVSYKTRSLEQLWNMHFAHNPIEVAQVNQQVHGSTFSEGRSLHFIENTLVSPHSKMETIATGFATLGEYMRLMIFPAELSFYYGYARTETVSWDNFSACLSMIIHLGLIALAIWQLNKRPLLSIGITWYLLSILLFSNWVELVAGMVGERLAFTASAGFCLMVAALVVWLKPGFNFKKPKMAEYAFMIIILLFAARTITRNSNWKDALTLMEHDIEDLDQSAYAQHSLGLTLMYVSNTDSRLNATEASNMQLQAITHFKQCIRIYPYFFNAHFDLARVYLANTDYVNAKTALLGAYGQDSTNLFVLEELAKTSFELKQADETAKYANLFLAKQPMNENVHEVLTYIMLMNNRKAEARQYAQRGLSYFPAGKNLNMMLRDASK